MQTLLLRARPYSREDWTTQLDGLRDEFEAFKEEQAKQEQAKQEQAKQEQAKPPSEPQGG